MERPDGASQAEAALAPYLRQIRAAVEGNGRQPARQPFRILVPLSFPEACDEARLWALPVVRSDVEHPQVDFRRRPSNVQRADIDPGAPTETLVGRVVRGRYGSLPAVDVYATIRGPSFHSSKGCSVLAVELLEVDPRLARVAAHLAHRSKLEACGNCAGGWTVLMDTAFGSMAPESRARLGYPKELMQEPLEDCGPRGSRTAQRDRRRYAGEQRDQDERRRPPYGEPDCLADPRFSVRASTDWGAAFYAKDPEEFLGEPSEDDHDWRNDGGSYLD